MSQLTFNVDLRQAMVRGENVQTPQPVTIVADVTKLARADRDLLASRLDDKARLLSRSEKYGGLFTNVLVTAPTPTVEGALEAIRAEDEAARTYEQRQKDAAARAKAEEEAKARQAMAAEPVRATRSLWLHLDSTGRTAVTEHSYAVFSDDEVGRFEYEYLDAWPAYPAETLPEGKALGEKLKGETAARRAAATAEAEARARAADEPRRAWIAGHGSTRLKRMLAEGIPHLKTYQAEHAKWEAARLDADLAEHRPDWAAAAEADIDTEPANVPTRAFALLDAARLAAPAAKLGKDKRTGKYVAFERYATAYGRAVLIYWPKD